jgi:mono/diheme cytochrome c family protein
MDLRCNTCHTVSGRNLGGTNYLGPELGNMVAGQSAHEIATSIVSPSHSLSSKGGLWRKKSNAKMDDYSSVMTVRQLVDVIAYLRSARGDHEKQTQK